MTKGTAAQHIAAVVTVAGVMIKTVGARNDSEVGSRFHSVRRGELNHCLRLHDWKDFEATAAEHHLRVTSDVVERRKQARMSCHATHQGGARVMDFAAQHDSIARFGRSDARTQCFSRQISGVFHPQRFKDVGFRKLVERLAASVFNNLAKQLKTHIAVDKLRAGSRLDFDGEKIFPGVIDTRLIVLDRIVGN